MKQIYRTYFLFLLLFLTSITDAVAQDVQWASAVVAFSSQYGNGDYSARQTLGVPNALGGLNLHDMAWVPKRENNPVGEYIQVRFKNPMRIRQIAIAESLNPGAITRIFLYDTAGKKIKVYENKNPKPVFAPFRLFRHRFALTSYEVAEVRVELKTKAIEGSNQIDAIGISSSNEPIRVKVNALEYEEEVGQAEKLSPSVNSEYAERLPIISPDGKTLYFARKYHPQNIGEDNNDDIWVAYRKSDGRWSNAINIGAPLNNRDHNFVAAFNPYGDILYLGSDYQKRAKDGVSVTYKRGRSWSNPKVLDIENHYNNSEFVCYHMSLDGQVLLMAVERDEGLGGLDIYVSFRQSNNRFSQPVNLGPSINTIGAESSIFLAADGKTIYFSSNGHEGYGGYDMFMSRRLDDSWQNWSPAKNLGSKINSAQNEYNYTIPASGEYAYFSSGDAAGMSDLYRILLPEEVRPEPVMLLSGRMINAETNRPLKAELKLNQLGKNTKETASGTPSDGNFQLVVPFGEDVSVYAETDGYFAVSQNLALSGNELEELDYDREGMLAQNETGNTIPTDNGAIEQLQLRLSELDEEMRQLNVQRQRVKEEYRQKESFQKNKPSNDPELEALRHKYNNTLRSKKETDQIQYGQNEPEEEIVSTGDKELDKLRQKYEQHYNQNQSESNSTPSSQKNTKKTKPKEDQALEDMKRRYQKHYQTEEKPVSSSSSSSSEEYQESSDFNLLEAAVRRQLQAELLPEVQADLRRALVNQEIRSIKNELSSDEQKQLLEDGFTDQLKQGINNTPIPEIKKRNEPLLSDPKWTQWVEDLEVTLQEEVRSDLTRELTPIVQKELRHELTYEIKRATEARIRWELDQEMAAQIEAEKNKYRELQSLPQNIEAIEEPTIAFQPEYQEVQQDILMFPIKVGQIIPMNNIFFDSNQASLKDASAVELRRVLRFLQENPKLVVEIGGHTNGWCSHIFANELSWERSQTVTAYFIGEGIPESRIQHRGYGKTKPIASNDTKAGRKKNQRVELKILEVLN